MEGLETMDNLYSSLTQKRSQVRVLFRPQIENELLDVPVERFLASLRFQQRGKLDQLGVEIVSID
jgi:hypothetical protein